jgi:aminopeptidase N
MVTGLLRRALRLAVALAPLLLPCVAATAGAVPETGTKAEAARAVARARAARGLTALLTRTEPTANQDAWDVTAYDLDLAPNLGNGSLAGSVRVRARVAGGPVLAMELDLVDAMAVDSVKVAGAPASFTHSDGLLTVDLGRAYATDEAVDLTAWYHGWPGPGAFGTAFASTSRYSRPLLWTLSEPYSARAWWPCKDHPVDKADSVSVRVTVPSGMRTVGNGTLAESSDDGVVAVTRWVERHPIATYLVSLASYPYAVIHDTYTPLAGGSMPVACYLFPEDSAWASAACLKLKDQIAVYAARFGEYPFVDEKFGEAEFTWGGGMENQTITSLGNPASEMVAAHELTHEWWGDWVTCRDFHHIWLNEGFATWGEALWNEATGGSSAYHATLANYRYFGPGTIHVPDPTDASRIFDWWLTYSKASWVPHMLRHVLGDSLCFAALREYGARHAYGTATTEDLQAVCEEVSGRSLGKFFQQWIYGERYPEYGFDWTAEAVAGGWDVTVYLQQLQAWQLFWMPVDVRIHTTTGARTFVAWDSLASQPFTFHVTGEPESVQVDPDEWILRTAGPLSVGPGGSALALLAPRPNPARAAANLAFWLPRATRARLEILDVRGARVATLADGPQAEGPHRLVWDGRDRGGHDAPPGLYVVRLAVGSETRTRRLVLVR